MQIEGVSDKQDLQRIVGDNSGLLFDAGVTVSASTIEVSMKETIINALSLCHILNCKAELDQFREGLGSLRVLECMKVHPELMKRYFVASSSPLTAGKWPKCSALNCL